eukprot:CAMPEP_0198350894 /NCGR_PEP_ID=MMETSP1450-20131203/100812_1 /TAXON_ID=753684 ORGANISM="Madagascaria erythrocladiodes, Strain CCMP3234" /NCGR_SAMPLE_ID=MMETSP1450 /ASSEMBLY_ACC=CAM_ASM_001115 /LENGTH=44 /DNA_ID= /DNA_START= /DNA_END= /DNA_ORIENTATION=
MQFIGNDVHSFESEFEDIAALAEWHPAVTLHLALRLEWDLGPWT